MATAFENVHGLYPGVKVIEKFTGGEKVKKNKDGTDYKSRVRVVKVIGMGFEEAFFYGGGEDKVKAFERVPEPGDGKLYDVVVPVEKDKEGKKRLGTPRFFPQGALKASLPEIGTVASALDESVLPGSARR